MSAKCNVNDWDEIQCVSTYMEVGDEYTVSGIFYDSFGFPAEGSIRLNVKNRTLHMSRGQDSEEMVFDYVLAKPMHIRTVPGLSRIELDGKQTLIIRNDGEYNNFVRLLRYIALAGKTSGTDRQPGGGDVPGESAGPGTAGEDVGKPAEGTEAAGEDAGKSAEDRKAEEDRRRARARVEDSESYKKLQELVGLDTVKKDVVELANLMKMQVRRKEQKLPEVPFSLHLVFSGNPGTGKTTIARILAGIYKDIGVLSKGQLVECDRGDLVAGYVGQTAIKTKKKIDEALGGILFIDEAYTLSRGENDFGQEAIDTILKAMEDHRDDFIVIVAGYTDLMKAFIESNPGLRSRFNKYIEFPDYTADELVKIFGFQVKKYNYELPDEANRAVEEKIRAMEAGKGENFANARDVRNLFEKIVTSQATRLASLPDADIRQITLEDVEGQKPGEEKNPGQRADPCLN